MQIAPAAAVPPLLERETELRTLRDAVSAACAGHGGIVLIEGQAGKGKSRLIDETAALAAAAGMSVLRARGDEHEREFPFGVALQLFEAPLSRAGPTERKELLSGTAGFARRLFETETSSTRPREPAEVLALVHGLFWVAHNLAERRPLILLFDDAHWTDIPSLQLVLYLANRIGDLQIAVVVTYRSIDLVKETPLAAAAAIPRACVLRLKPLSEDAVRQFVRARIREASDAFCEACAKATGGNPFFLQELLHTVAAEEVPPTDDGADQVRTLVPDAVSRSILLRLSRLPPDAVSLAQAVAVLGEASLVDAATLAHVDPDRSGGLADSLVAAGVLAKRDVLAYAHPIVRATIYEDTPRATRGRMELEAAQILLAGGAPVGRVAAHLLAAPPAREAWVLEPLRLAAAHAVASGAPHSAVRYLRRAAAEVRPSAELLVELGQAEAAAGEPGAHESLKTALGLLGDPLVRGRVQLMRGRALSAQGRYADAASAFQAGEAEVRGRDPALFIELEAGYLAVARLEPALNAAAAGRIERLVHQPPDEDVPAQRPLLADVALTQAFAGAPVDLVRPLVLRAWADGALLAEQGPDAMSIYLVTGALGSIDELELGLEVLGATLAQARKQGSVMAVATASYSRAFPLYQLARIPEALDDVELAVRAERDGWEMFVPPLRAFWALCLIERGDLSGAERALELPNRDRWLESMPYAFYLDARARLRLAQRRPREALEDASEAGRLLEETYGGTGRGAVQWRVPAALAAAAVGQRDRAARLCDEELEVARAGDRVREIGTALRTVALGQEGDRRIELLREAVNTLERSQTTLELLRTQVELGASLRRSGRRVEAREPLSRALEIASMRGATVIASRARDELLAAGARPRRTALGGVEALTPSELRVARLASEGLRNREIAELLFVTGKTVDYHLRNIYQKLDVTRAGLSEALAAKD